MIKGSPEKQTTATANTEILAFGQNDGYGRPLRRRAEADPFGVTN
jgi:hypothetical protein